MNTLFAVPTAYAKDFEEARAAYKPAKNDDKSDAYAAWTKTAKIRMSVGAFGHRMVECCRQYDAWIEAESVRLSRRNKGERYPKKHMSTWLNRRGWENFMTDAEAAVNRATADAAKEKVLTDGWEAEASKLIYEITAKKFEAYFANVQVTRGARTTLTFPNRFKADYCATNFIYALRRAFGDCTLTAAGSKDKFDI